MDKAVVMKWLDKMIAPVKKCVLMDETGKVIARDIGVHPMELHLDHVVELAQVLKTPIMYEARRSDHYPHRLSFRYKGVKVFAIENDQYLEEVKDLVTGYPANDRDE